jgi:hypothetical protein
VIVLEPQRRAVQLGDRTRQAEAEAVTRRRAVAVEPHEALEPPPALGLRKTNRLKGHFIRARWDLGVERNVSLFGGEAFS